MSTIKAQIAALNEKLTNDSFQAFDDEPKLREELSALSDRRLSKEQRAEISAIQQGLEEWDEAEQEAEEENYAMSKHLAKYRERYQKSVAASGAKSLNNGDELAKFLEMKTGKEVCELADKFVPLEGQTHFERYERLNEGQKRMNSGNKLRAALKKGAITMTEKGIQAI